MSASSSTALTPVEVASPATYAGESWTLRGWLARKGAWFHGKVLKLGEGVLLSAVEDAYADVRTAREASRAVELLLANRVVRQWMFNFNMVHNANAQSGGAAVEPPRFPWLSDDLATTVALLRECTQTFNRWMASRPDGFPPVLARLLQHAATPNFHRAFDDGRVPASLRLAYQHHHAVTLHVLALFLVDRNDLPTSIADPVMAALQDSLASALGLALALPGVGRLREKAGVEDFPVLDLEAEQRLWQEYLRDARPVG